MENTSNSSGKQQIKKTLRNDLLEFIPYIYKDLWEIGSTPSYKFELLKKNMLTNSKPKLLDLGCGKGAELIQLREKFEFEGLGVDILPEFIEEAIFRMNLNDCKDLKFIVDDFKANLSNYKHYDIVLFTHTGDIFGDMLATLQALKSTIKPSGFLLIDSYVRKSNAKNDYSLKFPTFKELKQIFGKCTCEPKGYIFWDTKSIIRSNQFKETVLKARINELIEKHSDKADLLKQFLNQNLEKMKLLETEIDTITWLLKAN